MKRSEGSLLSVFIMFAAGWFVFYQMRVSGDSTSLFNTGPSMGEYVFGSLAFLLALALVHKVYVRMRYDRDSFLERTISTNASRVALNLMVLFAFSLIGLIVFFAVRG